MSQTFALSSWFFVRAISLIYLVAFLSIAAQACGLWGSQGILPIAESLAAAERPLGWRLPFLAPSVFWISTADHAVIGFALAGATAALAALFGFAQGWTLLTCYFLYLSYVTVGQEFLSFQWDTLLLEAGFLTLFVVPWGLEFRLTEAVEPNWIARWLFYVLLFKLMFLSGVAKLTSGDRAWRDMTALTYHYWTQPLPNPISPFAHALPRWFHKASTLITFVIELAVPFLIFWPRARWLPAIAFTALSLLIFTTGNYTFFNLLAISLCFWLVPDEWWRTLWGSEGTFLSVATASNGSWGGSAIAVVGAILVPLNLYWCVQFWLPDTLQGMLNPIVRWVQPFHISSPYGLFANMTKNRPELTIEGSLDGRQWREYVFKFKPGPESRRPPVIEPFQPRLDWQMWFAALGRFQQSPWLYNLLGRLFQGSPPVLDFFAANPFPDEPPRYLRVRMYEYEFADPRTILTAGQWWRRRLVGEFSPTFERRD